MNEDQIKTWPSVIYLQHGGAKDESKYPGRDDVTWSDHAIHESDIEYVRADRLEAVSETLKVKEWLLQTIAKDIYEQGIQLAIKAWSPALDDLYGAEQAREMVTTPERIGPGIKAEWEMRLGSNLADFAKAFYLSTLKEKL